MFSWFWRKKSLVHSLWANCCLLSRDSTYGVLGFESKVSAAAIIEFVWLAQQLQFHIVPKGHFSRVIVASQIAFSKFQFVNILIYRDFICFTQWHAKSLQVKGWKVTTTVIRLCFTSHGAFSCFFGYFCSVWGRFLLQTHPGSLATVPSHFINIFANTITPSWWSHSLYQQQAYQQNDCFSLLNRLSLKYWRCVALMTPDTELLRCF